MWKRDMIPKNPMTFKSFADLSRFLMKRRAIRCGSGDKMPHGLGEATAPPRKDAFLSFQEAMRDVKPLPDHDSKTVSIPAPTAISPPLPGRDEDVACLEALVKSGVGFVVSSTSEYMAGTGYRVHPAVLDRLHRGDFAIQSHIDLHGLGVETARENLDLFLKDCIHTGKRQVLIIHGRGLSSPAEPVLKTRVKEWLTLGPWRKWVIAFASARICDGGAGATYVLLRRQPLTRRYKKKN